jgi:hypothetical protein
LQHFYANWFHLKAGASCRSDDGQASARSRCAVVRRLAVLGVPKCAHVLSQRGTPERCKGPAVRSSAHGEKKRSWPIAGRIAAHVRSGRCRHERLLCRGENPPRTCWHMLSTRRTVNHPEDRSTNEPPGRKQAGPRAAWRASHCKINTSIYPNVRTFTNYCCSLMPSNFTFSASTACDIAHARVRVVPQKS